MDKRIEARRIVNNHWYIGRADRTSYRDNSIGRHQFGAHRMDRHSEASEFNVDNRGQTNIIRMDFNSQTN